MKSSRIYLASAVALMAALTTSCNNHEDEPDAYRNVPIKLQWVPQFVTINWETVSPEVRDAVMELTKGVKVFRSREELAEFDEYGLFEDPLSSVVWDFTDSSVIASYAIISGIPDKTDYNVYFATHVLPGMMEGYVFNTSYTFHNYTDPGNLDVIVLGRNAVIVDKIPADAKVNASFGVSDSSVWS